MAPILQLVDVHKMFGDFVALERINLEIHDGEFVTIVGPSGSGKTTLIRMLVGMDQPTSGNILMRGERINEMHANQRPTCMVFQSLALFPHRSVGENIEFPMKIRAVPKATRRARAIELLKQLHLPEAFYHKGIHQCSGGERQRVALARALAFDPEILFFDEPLSALDYRLRKTLEKELKAIQRSTGKTFVYITHSIEEAMVMSDRIAILRSGRIVQVGMPDEIYHQPRDAFVAQFMGEINRFPVRTAPDGTLTDTETGVRYQAPTRVADSAGTVLMIRPEQIRILSEGEHMDNVLSGVLTQSYSLGSRNQYQVSVDGRTVLVEVLGRANARTGETVRIGWPADAAMLLKA
jgi:spermidine/putrescine transport system ATP-binding protein